MNRTIEQSTDFIIRFCGKMLQNLENNEVLYRSEEGFKQSLADVLATAKNIEATIKTLIEQVNAKTGNKRMAWLESELEKADKLVQKYKAQNGELMAENQYLRDEYYNKPFRSVEKLIPIRVSPRDAHDTPQRWQHVENHLFRRCHDKTYNPELKYENEFGSKIRTTTHLDL